MCANSAMRKRLEGGMRRCPKDLGCVVQDLYQPPGFRRHRPWHLQRPKSLAGPFKQSNLRSRATAPRSRSRAQVSAITWPMQLECSDCIGTDVVCAVNICGSCLRHTRHLQHCTCHETTLLSCHQLLAAQLRLSLGHAHVHWRGASTLISILNPKQHLQSVSARHVSAKHGCVGNIR